MRLSAETTKLDHLAATRPRPRRASNVHLRQKCRASAPEHAGKRLSSKGTSGLPEHLSTARRQKQYGLLASGLFLGSAAVIAYLSNVPLSLPQPQPLSISNGSLAWGIGIVLATLIGITCKRVAEDRLILELHNGRLYMQLDVAPRMGPQLAADSIQVRPAQGKGNGAFASKPISEGTYVGDYEGELLDEVTYWQRYPTGVADYCIGIDREWTIDGCERAKDTTSFSPCHMNHSDQRFNIARRCSRAERKVSFYAKRDIEVGEELLLDYGRLYWQGREDKKID